MAADKPAKAKRPRPTADDSAALAHLDRARIARETAEEAERQAVAAARQAGHSWSQIGALYGMTKQGAQQRFRSPAPEAPAGDDGPARRRKTPPEVPPGS